MTWEILQTLFMLGTLATALANTYAIRMHTISIDLHTDAIRRLERVGHDHVDLP